MTKMTMQRRASVIYLASVTTLVSGFSVNNHARIPLRSPSTLQVTTYGRGAEIWPECNEAPIQLADSFPGGTIPDEVLDTLAQIRLPVEATSDEKKKSFLPQPIRRMFSRTPEQAASIDAKVSLDKTPTVIAVALLLSGLVRPLDVSITVAISGYLAVLHYFARSPRADGLSPHVPALPPQGHVPDLVANPLGLSFTNSNEYDSWLKVGAVLSLFAPITAILRYTVFAASQGTQMGAAKACARPLFLLCCQALAESISRKVMAPLPLRILVPVSFNAARLAPLWLWAVSPALALPGRILAMANLLYWSVNLFGFLIPTATLRYMRAYFLCVESEQVVTRPGFESSVGMLP